MRGMKKALAALALLAAGCVSTAALPAPLKVPTTALAGTPCDPPMVIPPGIVASVRAQFEGGRTTPPPPITAEDGASYMAWIKTYAAEQGLVLADYFTPLATPDDAMKPELTLDGVHSNKAGYAAIEPVTRAAISKGLAP